MLSASTKRDIGTVVVALLSFSLLGTLGGAVLAGYAVPSGYYFGENTIASIYWLRCLARIVGRFTGDLVCGFLLGYCLRRFNPWHIFPAVVAMPIVVIALNRGFWAADDGLWVQSVGAAGAAVQLVLQVLGIAAVVSLGIWIGRRGRDSTAAGSESHSPSSDTC